MPVFFDDSLHALVTSIRTSFGADFLADGVILRDGDGMLSFISRRPTPAAEAVERAEKHLHEQLGAYAREPVLLFSDDLQASHILEDDQDSIWLEHDGLLYQVIDRRIVGSPWLLAPISAPARPPRVVFASLKGGVGRSTALTITASDMAARGLNVLVVDLDLEAPGLGELLLDDDRMPLFGVVDYLVEEGVGGVPDDLLSDFVGVSALTLGSGGRVDVLPALGSRSRELPENVLAKLSRALTDSVGKDGNVRSVSAKISGMIDRFSVRQTYDIVLIDSRAGLAELSAPAVLGLGAIVLLFGTAQRQTIRGYKALFAGLKLLAQRSVARGADSSWRLLFRPVIAKSSLAKSVTDRYQEDLYELFAANLYDEDVENGVHDGSLNFSPDDPSAPHTPLVIPFEPKFIDFDPVFTNSHLAKPFYELTFRPFLDDLDQLIQDISESLNGPSR